MKSFSLAYVAAGVVVAVIAGLIIAWIERGLSSTTNTGEQTGWLQSLFGGNQYVYGAGSTACTANPANANVPVDPYGPVTSPNKAATEFAGGAPTPTYRSFVRVGIFEVPAQ